jgi:hypothetical protein
MALTLGACDSVYESKLRPGGCRQLRQQQSLQPENDPEGTRSGAKRRS